MRPSSPVVIACLLALSSWSWVFPSDLEEGDYTVTLPRDHDPNEPPGARAAAVVVKRGPNRPPGDTDMFTDPMPPLPPVFDPSLTARVPMPVYDWYCRYDRFRFPLHAYLDVRRRFQIYCETYMVPNRTIHITVARNNAFGIFVCNLEPEAPQACFERELRWAEDEWLDPKCGQLVSGQIDVRERSMWYGRAYPGDMLCPPNKKQIDLVVTKQILEGLPTAPFTLPTPHEPPDKFRPGSHFLDKFRETQHDLDLLDEKERAIMKAWKEALAEEEKRKGGQPSERSRVEQKTTAVDFDQRASVETTLPVVSRSRNS